MDRRGFTLVEALVALVLFEVAALALVATTALTARDLATADRHARAFAMASDRVARIRGSACAGGASGALAHQGGLEERWRVEGAGPLRAVIDSVTIALPRGRTGAVVVRAWELCP